jgi:hypothetical protein
VSCYFGKLVVTAAIGVAILAVDVGDAFCSDQNSDSYFDISIWNDMLFEQVK